MYTVKDFYHNDRTVVTFTEDGDAIRYARRFDGLYVVDENGEVICSNISFPF